MKKWMLYCLILTISLVLTACGGNGGNEEGQNGGDNMNVDQTGFDGDTDTDNMNNNNGNDNNGNNNNNGEDQYELAEKAADRISKEIKQVDNAYVLKTDNNAYVAVEVEQNNNTNNGNNGNAGNTGSNNTNGMNNNNEQDDQLTDNVKNKISKIVKSVDKDVENVYVSANPDFFNLADNYAQDAGNGEPIEGIFDQLGNMIERVFPDNPNE